MDLIISKDLILCIRFCYPGSTTLVVLCNQNLIRLIIKLFILIEKKNIKLFSVWNEAGVPLSGHLLVVK